MCWLVRARTMHALRPHTANVRAGIARTGPAPGMAIARHGVELVAALRHFAAMRQPEVSSPEASGTAFGRPCPCAPGRPAPSRARALGPMALVVVALPAVTAQDRRAALDEAVRQLPAAQAPAGTAAAPSLRLVDLSLDVLAAAGASTERDEVLEVLQGGGHDPRQRGFTLQNVELSLTGAVDPYFTAEVHLVTFLDPIEGETVVELEEAFLTTTSLPAGLQLELGTFFTEFGRLNPRHPHAWDWLDQPVINTRIFGPDGMR